MNNRIRLKVVSSPQDIKDDKFWITCPICGRTKYEFDLTSEQTTVNCYNCASSIQILK